MKYRVRLLPGWTSGKELAKLWEKSGQIVTAPHVELLDLVAGGEEIMPDFWIIINAPLTTNSSPLWTTFSPTNIPLEVAEKCIIFYMEPRRTGEEGEHGRKSWGAWATPDPAKFLQVRDYHHYPNNAEWHLTQSCLLFDLRESKKKTWTTAEDVTAVVSGKRLDRGHHFRLDFLHYAEREAPGLFKIWGQCESENFKTWLGPLPPNEKDQALIASKYHLAAENNPEKNYFTEKIIDPIMAECLCFYWGCPNLPRWLDQDAFVYVDLENPPAALAQIRSALSENLYEQRLPAIQAMKDRIRRELTLVPTLDRIFTSMQKNYINDHFDKIIVINLDQSPERWENMQRQFQETGVTNYVRLSATDREMAERMVKQQSWKLPTAHLGRPGIDRRAQLGQLGKAFA